LIFAPIETCGNRILFKLQITCNGLTFDEDEQDIGKLMTLHATFVHLKNMNLVIPLLLPFQEIKDQLSKRTNIKE
jgi:hypothetical protein